eukprot:4526574-Prymnesium_polylepis.3
MALVFYAAQPQLGRPSCCPLGTVAPSSASMSASSSAQSPKARSSVRKRADDTLTARLARPRSARFCRIQRMPTCADVRLCLRPTAPHSGSEMTPPEASGE